MTDICQVSTAFDRNGTVAADGSRLRIQGIQRWALIPFEVLSLFRKTPPSLPIRPISGIPDFNVTSWRTGS